MYVVAIALGLRQGEVLGLRWRDIDFEGGTLSVRQTVKRSGGSWHYEEPKSPRSRRVLPLMPLVADELTAHRQRQREQRLRAGPAWRDIGLAFTSETGGPLYGPNVTRHLQDVLTEAKLPRVTFHDLRHACATPHVGLGTARRVLMSILGHASPTITLGLYAHADAAMMQDAVEALGAVLMAPQVAPQASAQGGG